MLGGGVIGAYLNTARTVRGAAWNMVFWEERALAATVPRSPSLSYSPFTFCMDLPVAWLRACKGVYCHSETPRKAMTDAEGLLHACLGYAPAVKGLKCMDSAPQSSWSKGCRVSGAHRVLQFDMGD